MRGGLVPIMMLLAATAGCRDTSGESASSDQAASLPAVPESAVEPLSLPPIEVIAGQQHRPSPQVRVQAQPAPLGSLDLPPSPDAAQATAFPQEVTSFMVDRDSCDHFRGEEAYDSDRRAYLAENIAELCTGTDARLAILRRRYAGEPAVVAALRGYEDRIETQGSY